MKTFWVTFRLKQDATYSARYQGMLDALVRIRDASWGEPTSFWIFSTGESITGAAYALTAPLHATTDLLVIREIDAKDCYYFGSMDHESVFKPLVPYAKKLP
jgi:hypothetical protein